MALTAQMELYDDAGRRKYLNASERQKFLEAANELEPPDQALLYVLTFSGCRVSEALTLSPHQLDADRDTLTFRTLKRRRKVFRTVPIPTDVTRMLIDLACPVSESFWTMHRATAWRLVSATMDGAGIQGPMACCKGLRHSFGIRAADRNVPANLIQRWMGHASPSTTAIYVDAIGAEERAFATRMW